jgi:hypothetical protein
MLRMEEMTAAEWKEILTAAEAVDAVLPREPRKAVGVLVNLLGVIIAKEIAPAKRAEAAQAVAAQLIGIVERAAHGTRAGHG